MSCEEALSRSVRANAGGRLWPELSSRLGAILGGQLDRFDLAASDQIVQEFFDQVSKLQSQTGSPLVRSKYTSPKSASEAIAAWARAVGHTRGWLILSNSDRIGVIEGNVEQFAPGIVEIAGTVDGEYAGIFATDRESLCMVDYCPSEPGGDYEVKTFAPLVT